MTALKKVTFIGSSIVMDFLLLQVGNFVCIKTKIGRCNHLNDFSGLEKSEFDIKPNYLLLELNFYGYPYHFQQVIFGNHGANYWARLSTIKSLGHFCRLSIKRRIYSFEMLIEMSTKVILMFLIQHVSVL